MNIKKLEKMKVLISAYLKLENKYKGLNEKLDNEDLNIKQKNKILSDMNYIRFDQVRSEHSMHCYVVELGLAEEREYGELEMHIDRWHTQKVNFRKPSIQQYIKKLKPIYTNTAVFIGYQDEDGNLIQVIDKGIKDE